jgi:hypothetical protein
MRSGLFLNTLPRPRCLAPKTTVSSFSGAAGGVSLSTELWLVTWDNRLRDLDSCSTSDSYWRPNRNVIFLSLCLFRDLRTTGGWNSTRVVCGSFGTKFGFGQRSIGVFICVATCYSIAIARIAEYGLATESIALFLIRSPVLSKRY